MGIAHMSYHFSSIERSGLLWPVIFPSPRLAFGDPMPLQEVARKRGSGIELAPSARQATMAALTVRGLSEAQLASLKREARQGISVNC